MFGNQDEFEGLGIFLDTLGLLSSIFASNLILSRYANARHEYAFPRIVGILGDGKTKYNYGSDGDEQAIGACSVCLFVVTFTYNDSKCSSKGQL